MYTCSVSLKRKEANNFDSSVLAPWVTVGMENVNNNSSKAGKASTSNTDRTKMADASEIKVSKKRQAKQKTSKGANEEAGNSSQETLNSNQDLDSDGDATLVVKLG